MEGVAQPEWRPLLRAGSVGVEFRVLLQGRGIVLAHLRFAEHSAIDEHSAAFDIDVMCLAGSGSVSVDGKAVPFSPGELVTWPAGVYHQLWTKGTEMETLMVEHHKPRGIGV